jgi:hypothetical protein
MRCKQCAEAKLAVVRGGWAACVQGPGSLQRRHSSGAGTRGSVTPRQYSDADAVRRDCVKTCARSGQGRAKRLTPPNGGPPHLGQHPGLRFVESPPASRPHREMVSAFSGFMCAVVRFLRVLSVSLRSHNWTFHMLPCVSIALDGPAGVASSLAQVQVGSTLAPHRPGIAPTPRSHPSMTDRLPLHCAPPARMCTYAQVRSALCYGAFATRTPHACIPTGALCCPEATCAITTPCWRVPMYTR